MWLFTRKYQSLNLDLCQEYIWLLVSQIFDGESVRPIGFNTDDYIKLHYYASIADLLVSLYQTSNLILSLTIRTGLDQRENIHLTRLSNDILVLIAMKRVVSLYS